MALVTVREFYDTKTRPTLVKQGLMRIGAEKVRFKPTPARPLEPRGGKLHVAACMCLNRLCAPPPPMSAPLAPAAAQYFNQEQIDLVASLTTVQALMDKGAELQGIATPYIKKARYADGRKELAVLANDNIIKPTVDVAAVHVQPYVEKANEKIIKPTRERVAPLVAVVERKRSELVGSPRFKRAMESLNHVRAHPIEAAQELKSKAIDLIKYDDLVSYREYVLSPEFQADTLKLLKEDLPNIAKEAARRGLELLHSSTVKLSEELQAKRAMLMEHWKRGYTEGRYTELEKLRNSALHIVSELKAKLLTTANTIYPPAADFNVHETIARLTKIFKLESFFGAAAPAAGEDAPTDAPAKAAE